MSRNSDFTISLAGNPNVGKSTIFNALTNLRQHTGNWAGKTVACATGRFVYQNADCRVVDLPGIYSLRTHSEEEEIAREYICSGDSDLLLVVADATCLERGLHLLKQIGDLEDLALSDIILCVNLCDEAKKKGILLDFSLLSEKLQIPVIPCAAREKHGLDQLKTAIYQVFCRWSLSAPAPKPALEAPALCPACLCCENCGCCSHARTQESVQSCEGSRSPLPDFVPKDLAAQAVTYTNPVYRKKQEKLDRLLTGRFTGSLIMILLLLGVFWLTITGANYPSAFLWDHFFILESKLAAWMEIVRVPGWFISASVYGVFRVVAWIVSVMLPPMAIFFPLFTLLEDLGYLPRVAFNMDCAFKKCKACGKQCLTMCIVKAARPFSVNIRPSISRTVFF